MPLLERSGFGLNELLGWPAVKQVSRGLRSVTVFEQVEELAATEITSQFSLADWEVAKAIPP